MDLLPIEIMINIIEMMDLNDLNDLKCIRLLSNKFYHAATYFMKKESKKILNHPKYDERFRFHLTYLNDNNIFILKILKTPQDLTLFQIIMWKLELSMESFSKKIESRSRSLSI